jgi:hypothetical protein
MTVDDIKTIFEKHMDLCGITINAISEQEQTHHSLDFNSAALDKIKRVIFPDIEPLIHASVQDIHSALASFPSDAVYNYIEIISGDDRFYPHKPLYAACLMFEDSGITPEDALMKAHNASPLAFKNPQRFIPENFGTPKTFDDGP